KFLLTIKNVIMDNERLNELSGKILDAAIEVHRILGPGLLEIVLFSALGHPKFKFQFENYLILIFDQNSRVI
ncbi:MAG: hypothetical protein WCB90_13205, partial [Methanosarcina sp.]